MKILVTGVYGFVGRNLISQLHNIQNGVFASILAVPEEEIAELHQ